MLIEFCVKNWESFRDEVVFQMNAGKERKHGDRVMYLKPYRMRVLPIAAVFGGNAAGKTNLVSAIKAMQTIVVRIPQPDDLVEVRPFLLDSTSSKKTTEFRIILLVDGRMYNYSFSATRLRILKEELYCVHPASEERIYHRDENGIYIDKDEYKDSLQSVADSTRPNMLFLTNTFFQRRKELLGIYNWFKNTLVIIPPSQVLSRHAIDDMLEIDTDLLSRFDTGIVGLKKRIRGRHPDVVVVNISHSSKEDKNSEGHNGKDMLKKTMYSFLPKACEICTQHDKIDSKGTVSFTLSQESEGTVRLLHILPIWRQLMSPGDGKVVVMDEMNRSFHYLLAKKLIELYLESCGTNNRSQLIFTTHDLLLMDQSIFRRDEMWVVSKCDEISSINSLQDSGFRYDKDIRKGYIQGYFGGTPYLT